MQIDTNIHRELPDDHPTAQELNKEERGLYSSTIEGTMDFARAFEKYRQQNSEIDPEAPELEDARETLQIAIALSQVLEEIATWRKHGIIPDSEDKNLSPHIKFESAGSHMESKVDE